MLELEFLCFYNNAMDLTKTKFKKNTKNTKSQFTKNQRFKKKSYNLRSALFKS